VWFFNSELKLLKYNFTFPKASTIFLGSIDWMILIWQTKRLEVSIPKMRMRRQMRRGAKNISPMYWSWFFSHKLSRLPPNSSSSKKTKRYEITNWFRKLKSNQRLKHLKKILFFLLTLKFYNRRMIRAKKENQRLALNYGKT
jgi:hypothetical protein